MNPERIEFVRDAQLVCGGKIDAFALAAIAQGRVVYLDFGFHSDFRVCGKPYLSEMNPGCKPQNRRGRKRAHPDTVLVWSSAFRRSGQNTAICRLKAELQTLSPVWVEYRVEMRPENAERNATLAH
jgi:hypothetical protein